MKRKIISTALLLGLLCMAGGMSEAAEYIPVRRKAVSITQVRPAKPVHSSKKMAAAAKKAAPKATHKKQPAAAARKSAFSPNMEVGLLSGAHQVSLKSLTAFDVEAEGKRWKSFPKGTNINVSYGAKGITVNGKTFKNGVLLRPSGKEASFIVKGNRYRGEIKIIPSAWAKGLTVVNVVSLDDYLKGVIPCEVVPTWHMDALKAQAVAARTYAVYHKNSYRKGGYDVTDDTRSQVYRGADAETAATTRAVMETAGEIITYAGKPIDAVFHSSGGGYTENSENVWGTSVPYLRGVPETVKTVPWTKNVSLDVFSKTLSGASPSVGAIKRVKLSRLKKSPVKAADRGISGRVKSVELIGTKGKAKVSGEKLQELFKLPSTLFDIRRSKKQVIITGYGSGHGLGLSQWGAENMAARSGGKKDYYKNILSHYYPGTEIEKIY